MHCTQPDQFWKSIEGLINEWIVDLNLVLIHLLFSPSTIKGSRGKSCLQYVFSVLRQRIASMVPNIYQGKKEQIPRVIKAVLMIIHRSGPLRRIPVTHLFRVAHT